MDNQSHAQWSVGWYHPFPNFNGCRFVAWGPFYKHGLTLITEWIIKYIHYKVLHEIIYPLTNGAMDE